MKKNKYFLFFSLIVVLLMSGAGIAHALELSYPPIPGLPSIPTSCWSDNTDCLPRYIAYWFGLLIYIAGILALISFTVGAVVFLVSMENPELKKSGADRMKGAALGLVLTLASFIILKTINPAVINPIIQPLPGGPGIFYYNGKDTRPVLNEVVDVAARGEDLISGGFDKLIYKCSNAAGSTLVGQKIMIWEFPKPGLEDGNGDLSGVKVVEKYCGDVETIGGLGSFRIALQTPGIYYYLGDACGGYASSANLNSGVIESPFYQKIKSIKIINDDTTITSTYGFILHGETSLSGNVGECSSIEFLQCNPVEDPTVAASIDIFQINKTPSSSGIGVSFYSKPWGEDISVRGGVYDVLSKDIATAAKKTLFLGINLNHQNTMCFDYSNSKAVSDFNKYKCNNRKCDNSITNNMDSTDNGAIGCSDAACETFQDQGCQGSMQINGSYLVAFYSIDSNGTHTYCQTFTRPPDPNNGVVNLKVEPLIGPGTSKIDFVYVVPIK